MNYKITIVDDDPEIIEIISVLLSSEGYKINTFTDPVLAAAHLEKDTDLYILDVMMPNLNGYQLAKKIREFSKAPILFLTAKSQDNDKALGFLSGGDDYLVKPFSFNELQMRIKALLRRYYDYSNRSFKKEEEYTFGPLTIVERKKEVLKNNQTIRLTDLEFQILIYLIQNRNQVLSLSQIYEAVWNEPAYYGIQNTVMVHIRNLRKKIEDDPQNPQIIKTLWGRGYYCEE